MLAPIETNICEAVIFNSAGFTKFLNRLLLLGVRVEKNVRRVYEQKDSLYIEWL